MDAGWPQLVGVAYGAVLIYNANTGVAVTGVVYQDGSFAQYNVYGFSTGWTHFAGANGQLLIYNADTGLAVTGSLGTNGTFTQFKTYGFSTGWTHFSAGGILG